MTAEGSGTGPPGRTQDELVQARRARIEEIRELAAEYGHESATLSSHELPSSGPIPEGGIFWIAEDAASDVTLGYAAASLRPDGLTIGPVYVRPQERRRGVGQALLQAMQRWAEETGIPVVEVSVSADNEAVRSFLESAGYVPRRILFSHPGTRVGERSWSRSGSWLVQDRDETAQGRAAGPAGGEIQDRGRDKVSGNERREPSQ